MHVNLLSFAVYAFQAEQRDYAHLTQISTNLVIPDVQGFGVQAGRRRISPPYRLLHAMASKRYVASDAAFSKMHSTDRSSNQYLSPTHTLPGLVRRSTLHDHLLLVRPPLIQPSLCSMGLTNLSVQCDNTVGVTNYP